MHKAHYDVTQNDWSTVTDTNTDAKKLLTDFVALAKSAQSETKFTAIREKVTLLMHMAKGAANV